ncbi:MAG: hypothetical protein CMA03_05135 [Euryarchaeota archaeon]|nr:hypothetical protein [Euryarchaeota archaeon]|tara:strand:- start:412 stop:846 length:435 start_codon:yes stop_codon:yes gene_type:complete
MRQQKLHSDESGQMLLAAGLVLLMSLLSMSLYGVKVAGYDLPRTSDVTDVFDAMEEVESLFLPSLENRTQVRFDAGMSLDAAALDSLETIEYDIKSHGVLRGMQFSFTETEVIVDENNVTVNTILNIVSDSTIELPLSVSYDVS